MKADAQFIECLTAAAGDIVSSATYDSFGNATGNLSTRYQYTGREKDETTGLMYYRNRWYDSNLGRFISEDPIGLSGGINQFGYVGGNPVGFTDPSGLFPVNDVSTVTQTVTQTVSLLDQVIANTASEQNRNAKLLAEIIANSSPQAKAAAATGTASALAYGGTSVAAAGAAPVVGTVAGGLVIGGAIGLPIGIYTSELASNPFVNGSLNPFGRSASEVANESWSPQTSSEACEVTGSYLLEFQSGMFYAGKGPEARMRESIRRIESTGDLLKPGGAQFFPASSTREAFINEHRLMKPFGLPSRYNPNSLLYNKIWSPGKKLSGE